MKVYLVMGGCITDEHVIAVYTAEKKAEKRAAAENKREPALEAYVEEWEIKDVRRQLGIEEGCPMEIYITDGCVLLRKYQPDSEDFMTEIEALHSELEQKDKAIELAQREAEEQLVKGTGHWLYDPNGMDWNLGAWICSECHCKNDNLPHDTRLSPYQFAGSKFCPNCGARMTPVKEVWKNENR